MLFYVIMAYDIFIFPQMLRCCMPYWQLQGSGYFGRTAMSKPPHPATRGYLAARESDNG